MNKLYNLDFYDYNMIKKAVVDYKKLGKLISIKIGNKALVMFKDTVYDMEITVKEFNNYVIELMNSGDRNL